MIPDFTTPFIRSYGSTLMILLGIAVGMEYARIRVVRESLSLKLTVSIAAVTLISAFLVSHVASVLVYSFEDFQQDWTMLIRFGSAGHSSYGGFLGAAIFGPLYIKLRKAPVWAYADNLVFGFILGWTFGRTGCFLAHDHKGTLTSFFLAVKFPDGSRHDLGLYEAILSALILMTMIVLERQRTWFHGFFIGLAMVLYAPGRFFLDFLRGQDLETLGDASDVRWAGLTPGHYGSVLLFLLGICVLAVRHKSGRQNTHPELRSKAVGP